MMPPVIPRFEFRIFGYDLSCQQARLQQLASLAGREEQEDVYLMTAVNDCHHIRVRNGRLDIKYLIQKKNGLEQWQPFFWADFPLDVIHLRWHLFPSLNTIAPSLAYTSYNQQIFWDQIIKPNPTIFPISVVKHRFRYCYHAGRAEISAEISHLCINGTPFQTLAIEAEHDEAVQYLRDKLGLQTQENVNYLLAFKRIVIFQSRLADADDWLVHGVDVGE